MFAAFSSRGFRRLSPVWMLAALLLSLSGFQTGAHDGKKHQGAAAAEAKDYIRTEARYRIPDVALTDMYGKERRLRDLIDGEAPVLMEFIFTTCATICPVLSASFANSQDALGRLAPGYRMVSISIDPEYDTPRKLRAYAERFTAGDRWQFLTGSQQDIAAVQKAFDAFYPGNNKMYHRPYTYLRAGDGTRWVRIDGLLGTADLVAEYRRLADSDS